MPVVGFIRDGSAEANARNAAAFRKGLNETGYRKPERDSRVPLAGGSIRSPASTVGRPGAPTSGSDRHARHLTLARCLEDTISHFYNVINELRERVSTLEQRLERLHQ